MSVSAPPAPRTAQLSSVDELRELVAEIAADRASWEHHVRQGVPEDRWYVRLSWAEDVEVWLLGWGVTHDTQLHDHGDSRGAFHLVEGRLDEERAGDDGRLVTRRLTPGDTTGIERGDVHNVVSPGPTRSLSIHAYSPPLTHMTYYETKDGLHAVRTLAVDGPDDEAAG